MGWAQVVRAAIASFPGSAEHLTKFAACQMRNPDNGPSAELAQLALGCNLKDVRPEKLVPQLNVATIAVRSHHDSDGDVAAGGACRTDFS